MKNKLKKIIVCFVLILSTFLLTTNIFKTGVVFADTNNTKYTDVLQDLKHDKNFNTENYPINNEDYSLQIIQVAENVENKLFVYVYQPCVGNIDLRATCINMALGKNTDNKLYNLKFINSNGVFIKYCVDEFTISSEKTRVYDIVSIYRNWYEKYDNGLEKINNNDISEVAFNVSKEFVISINGDVILTTCYDIETIEIVNKYVGFVRYSGKSNWINSACDRQFIAFSTNKNISQILEADIYFSSQTVENRYADNSQLKNNSPFRTSFGEKNIDNYSHIDFRDKSEVAVGSSGLIGNNQYINYVWDRVQSVSEFLDSVNVENTYSIGLFDVNIVSKITSEGLSNIEDKQWVLSFVDTDYTLEVLPTGGGGIENYTIVGDVSILRLKFKSDGLVYDLGVVDNKQSGSFVPDNTVTVNTYLSPWIKKLLSLVLLVLLVVLITPLLPTIFKIIITILSYILKIILFIIKLPITIIKKIKHKGGGKNASCKNKK